jgi:predicted permease
MFSLLTGSRWVTGAAVDGYQPRTDQDTLIEASHVTPGYFETVGAPLLAGRLLETRDREGEARVAVVNQAFARRFFSGQSPVGGRFGIDGEESSREIEIVGMVRDLKYHDLWQEAPPLVYFPVAQDNDYLFSLQVHTDEDPAAVAPLVRGVLSRVAPDLPMLDLRTMTAQIELSLRQEKMLSRLTVFFGLLALLLASIGLYGVVAFGVSQKTSEIGIRMALGAERGGVLWMVLRRAMEWVGVGVAIGLAAALIAGRLVSSLLFGLAPNDLRTILAATVTLVVVAALAAYWPARRASRLDPMQALRYE